MQLLIASVALCRLGTISTTTARTGRRAEDEKAAAASDSHSLMGAIKHGFAEQRSYALHVTMPAPLTSESSMDVVAHRNIRHLTLHMKPAPHHSHHLIAYHRCSLDPSLFRTATSATYVHDLRDHYYHQFAQLSFSFNHVSCNVLAQFSSASRVRRRCCEGLHHGSVRRCRDERRHLPVAANPCGLPGR